MEIVRPGGNVRNYNLGTYEKLNREPDEMIVVENYVYMAFNDFESPEILILKFQSRAPLLIPVLASVFAVALAGIIWTNIKYSRDRKSM